MDRDLLKQRLEVALVPSVKGEFRVDSLELLTGGSAAQTWRFTLQRATGAAEYILRLAHEGSLFELAIDKRTEAAVQTHAVAHGVLAANIIHILAPEDQLGEGFVMDLIRGETIPQKILRQDQYRHARRQLAAQCGRQLAAIHQVPIQALPYLRDSSVAPQLAQLHAFYTGFGEVIPVFDYAFRWLGENMQPCDHTTLVHGDFRNGNLIVNEQGIAAILDWELAHLGDPMEDLGWLCVTSWRFGNNDLPVGGFGSRQDLYAAYESAGGRCVNEDAVHFWEILGTLKWGVICLYQTTVHLSGEERSVNRAAIGRRVSETELDLLALFNAR